MKEVWMLKNKTADFNRIMNRFNVSMPTARLLVNRGYCEEEEIEKFLHPHLKDIPSFHLLKDIGKAVGLLRHAIDNGSFIRIVGDYDVDGVVSTVLLMKAFQELGAYVSYKIPDRVADGYGISRSIIEEAVADGIDVIVTCDNGISAVSQIEYAKEQGMTVIVTDHHEIPEQLPPADCIINPKQRDCEYPGKGICGAMVAAKLCEALYEAYGFGSFIEKNLDILALATVCDVMELTGENRVIVKLGLEVLNKKNNIGIKALCEVNGLEGKKISTYHLGFVLGPCLNATGRLESADAGVELLRTEDEKEAKILAGHLKELNEIRKEKTQKGINSAVDRIENSSLINDSVIVVELKNCHESIAGIIAGKVKEKYNRPVIIFTESTSDEQVYKGSGRSVEAYNMFEGINSCVDLLIKFGGHPMAAGMTIEKANLDKFRTELNKKCCEDLKNLPRKVLIDIGMSMSFWDFKTVEELSILEPIGNGNEKPVFADRNVTIKRITRFGKESNFLKFELIDSRGVSVNGKMFSDTEEFMDDYEKCYGEYRLNEAFNGRGNDKVHLIYSPENNEYNGLRSVQVMINSWMFPENAEIPNSKACKELNKSESNEGSDSENVKSSSADTNQIKALPDDRCLIFCAGKQTILPFDIKNTDYIIAADGGYNYAKALNIIPNELMGDFDSLRNPEELNISAHTKITKVPVEKDYTDAAMAMKRAIKLGYKNIYLIGACGGNRIEHTIANISLLAYGADFGVNAYMFDEKSCLTVIKDAEITFDDKCTGDISVFAFGGKAMGVTEKNLKYEVEDVDLVPEVSLGVSNLFIGKRASVSVKSGKLLVVGDYLPEMIKVRNYYGE